MGKSGLFVWKSRPATSSEAGDGFFTMVGGYEVLVMERCTGRPVTGGTVVAGSAKELTRIVERMLKQFERQWRAQTVKDRRRNMAMALRTAIDAGWV